VGPGAGRDRCGKSRPTGIRSPDPPARSVVAIPSTLFRLRTFIVYTQFTSVATRRRLQSGGRSREYEDSSSSSVSSTTLVGFGPLNCR
jgi:hypothetical protein